METSPGYKKESSPLRLRFISIWKMLTSRNYILICNIEKGLVDGQSATSAAYICRTDLNYEDELLALAGTFERIKRKNEPTAQLCGGCQEEEDFCTCHVEETCGVCLEHLDDCECTEEELKGTYH